MSKERPDVDPPPDDEDLPGDWEDGEARYAGGGIWIRRFRSEERDLRIGCDLHTFAVYVETIEWDEDMDMFVSVDGELVAECEDDSEGLEACLDLIKRIEAGETAFDHR